MYTEDEAREKWCPHALRRHDAVNVETCGRGVRDEPITFCIGSACMAWRWSGPQVEVEINSIWTISKPPEGWRYIVSYDDGKARFERALSDDPHTGYCGLSGSPYMGGE